VLDRRLAGSVSGRECRVLVVTPDYPPARGGIQLLIGRVVEHAERIRSRVVTLESPGSQVYDRERGDDVVRAPLHSVRRLSG
jgi:hypothetical protein